LSAQAEGLFHGAVERMVGVEVGRQLVESLHRAENRVHQRKDPRRIVEMALVLGTHRRVEPVDPRGEVHEDVVHVHVEDLHGVGIRDLRWWISDCAKMTMFGAMFGAIRS